MNQLELMGGFAPAEPQRVTIEWDGKKGEIFIRVVSYAEMQKLLTEKIPDTTTRDAHLVQATLRLGDTGQEQLTAEQVGNLMPTLFRVIREEALVLNGLRERVEGDEPEK